MPMCWACSPPVSSAPPSSRSCEYPISRRIGSSKSSLNIFLARRRATFHSCRFPASDRTGFQSIGGQFLLPALLIKFTISLFTPSAFKASSTLNRSLVGKNTPCSVGVLLLGTRGTDFATSIGTMSTSLTENVVFGLNGALAL